MDVWSSATGEELGRCDQEILGVLRQATLYVVPAPAKYEAPYPLRAARDANRRPSSADADDEQTASTKSSPLVVRTVDPTILAQWDARLFDAIQVQVAAGFPALYTSSAFGSDGAIIQAAAGGALVLKSQGGEITWQWQRLGRSDRRSLAARLRTITPAEHALVAFHLLEAGDRSGAQRHLNLAGAEALTVQDLFKSP